MWTELEMEPHVQGNPALAPSAGSAAESSYFGAAGQAAATVSDQASTASDLLTLGGQSWGPLDLIGKVTDAYNVASGAKELWTGGVDAMSEEAYGKTVLSGLKLASNFVPGGELASAGLTMADLATKPYVDGGLSTLVGMPTKAVAQGARDAYTATPEVSMIAGQLATAEPDYSMLPAPQPVTETMGMWPPQEMAIPAPGTMSTTVLGGGAPLSVAAEPEDWLSGYVD